MEREETVLDTFSPASKYEAMLLERGGVGLNEDKTLLVFQVLDQIIPHLGVFIQVMKSCRDELFEAVYSDQYTGSDKGSSEKRYIQKVPYFTLVKRIFGERDEQNVELSEHLDVVKKRLFDKQKQYEEACDKIELLESQANELRANVKNLEEHLEDKNNEVESLENCLEDERKTFERTQAQLKCDIQDLEADLQERKDQVAYLRNYKLGYDDLQAAFNDNPGLDEPFTPKRKKKAAVATKRANLISNIENAIKLEEQILTVQNCTIEEFDAFLEEHKGELAEKSAEEDHDDPSAAQEHEYEIEQADQQLLVVQERFKKNIDEMNTELSLLRQHRSMIQEQLQQLEESRPQHIRKKKKVPTATLR